MKRNLWKLMIVLALVICVLPMAAFAEGEEEPFQCPKHQWVKTGDTATCVSAGSSSWLCTVPGCGLTTTESSPVNPNNHVGKVTVSVTEPKCGVPGSTKYSCSCGGQTWSEEIPGLRHSWDAGVGTEPTCDKDGKKTYTCGGCGLVTTETTPALGHSWGEGVGPDAQCGKAGSKTYTCGVCNGTKTETLPALKHSWDAGVGPDAQCGVPGSKTYTCQNGCGLVTTEEIPALVHDWEVTSDTATCKEAGTATSACSHCGGTKEEPSPAKGHQWKLVKQEPVANCWDPGVNHYSCTLCPLTTTENVPALKHRWDEGKVTKAATCTEAGAKLFTCGGCGLTTSEPIAALNHAWDSGKVTKAATCSAKGVKTFTCTRNSAHTKTEDIPSTGGHKLSSMVKDSSQHWQYCLNPGCKYVVGGFHEFSNWRVARKATAEKDGTLRKDCAYCDQKLWSSYEYSDNPKTDDPLVPMMALLLASTVLLPMTLRYTRRKWKYWV